MKFKSDKFHTGAGFSIRGQQEYCKDEEDLEFYKDKEQDEYLDQDYYSFDVTAPGLQFSGSRDERAILKQLSSNFKVIHDDDDDEKDAKNTHSILNFKEEPILKSLEIENIEHNKNKATINSIQDVISLKSIIDDGLTSNKPKTDTKIKNFDGVIIEDTKDGTKVILPDSKSVKLPWLGSRSQTKKKFRPSLPWNGWRLPFGK